MEYVRSPFEPAEYEALSELADRNVRPIPNEVRYIVREALKQAGLLEQTPTRQAVGMQR
jgi:hypothetical protein